uniref:Putative reverse transcriptase domain-containing protein n=1 Tax=Tanacetum cinerariifolium TaxID=118510 RepID=A0A6L2NTF9_TANCI|nr:putative reverse transcriptase domain-containing protein [Tanacetum cinerariifolium]
MCLKEVVMRQGIHVSIISDCDGRFASNFWRSLHKDLGTTLAMSIAYHLEIDRQSERTIQTLEDMLRAFQETTEKIIQIKQRIQAAHDRQKSYADLKRKLMEFQVGDRVMLKVSPWKGVVRFGKRGKLNPSYVGPFKLSEKVGSISYKLELPQQLSRVHSTFYVSNLKKCYSDGPLAVPLDGIHIDDKLYFVEEPVEIMDQDVKWLKQSCIPIVKNEKEYEEHLKAILGLLKEEKLYAKFLKCEFWISKKLCSAPILALPEGSEDFVVYCDASYKGLGAITKCTMFTDHKSLQHILDQKDLNMRQQRWLELLSDYDCDIRYHPGKANVVTDALSHKERDVPLRVRALVMTISLDLPKQILAAQIEALKQSRERRCRNRKPYPFSSSRLIPKLQFDFPYSASLGHDPDYCCFEGSLGVTIICDINKTPDLTQRPPQNCPKYGNPVDGHYCQGCAILQKKFKEDLFTYCIENGILQDSFEPSNDNTNVVNALQEPFVVEQDPGGPPQTNHHCCYGCGDSSDYLDPEPCNNQTVDELPQSVPSFDPTRYYEDGNSFTYDFRSNLVDDSPNVLDPPPQPPLYSCEFYRNDARYGHYCTPQIPFIYPEPCYNQDFKFPQDFHDFKQQYLCCENCGGPHEAYQCQPMNEDYYHEQNSCYDPNSFGFDQFQPRQYTVNRLIFNAQNDLLNSQNKLMEQLASMCDMVGQYIQTKEEEKQIEEEQAAKARYWKIPVCYNDDDDEDYTIAVTPILSTMEPDNFLSMGDEHLDTISAIESDEFIKSSVENLVLIPSGSEGILDNMCDVPFHDNSSPLDILKDQFEDFFDSNNDSTSIDDDSFSIDNIKYVEASPPNSELVSLEVMEIVTPKVGGIDDDILLTIKDDILCEKLLSVNLLIANIETLKDNPTPSSNFMIKSSSTSFNSLLDETSTFDNSLPESETFCFNLEEISSGSTTTCSDISLPEYEAFYDDHIKEISSGSTTTHSDSSICDLFIFDLSINPLPPADRSDFYEFADELAHIISLPEYDCFHFKNEPNSRDFTLDVVNDIFPTREPRVHVHNVLPTHPTLQLNLDFILSSESLFAYVVWIFLPFLSYSVAPQYLLTFRNEYHF